MPSQFPLPLNIAPMFKLLLYSCATILLLTITNLHPITKDLFTFCPNQNTQCHQERISYWLTGMGDQKTFSPKTNKNIYLPQFFF